VGSIDDSTPVWLILGLWPSLPRAYPLQYAVTHGEHAIVQQNVATVEITEAMSQVVKGVRYQLSIRATAKTYLCQVRRYGWIFSLDIYLSPLP
jgi:hypothetical protein